MAELLMSMVAQRRTKGAGSRAKRGVVPMCQECVYNGLAVAPKCRSPQSHQAPFGKIAFHRPPR